MDVQRATSTPVALLPDLASAHVEAVPGTGSASLPVHFKRRGRRGSTLSVDSSGVPRRTIGDDTYVHASSVEERSSMLSLEEFLNAQNEDSKFEEDDEFCDYDDYELRLEVYSATELRAPEYRVGDTLRNLVRGEESLCNQVYVELELGGRVVRTNGTSQMDKNDDRSAYFEQEKLLFPYRGERQLKVRVRNHRHLGAVVRGDPLIGEGTLRLGGELQDGQRRMCVVPIQRGEPSGFVSMQYQVLTACGQAASATRAAVNDHMTAFTEAGAAALDAGRFFENLQMESASFKRACDSDFLMKQLTEDFK